MQSTEDMLLDEIHMQFQSTAYYQQQTSNPDMYLNYALKGEVGELHNVAKKMMRMDGKDYRSAMVAELGDVWYYFVELIRINQRSLYEVLVEATCGGIGIDRDQICVATLDSNWATNVGNVSYGIMAMKPDLDQLYHECWYVDYQRSENGYAKLEVLADFFNVLMKIHRKLQITLAETLAVHIDKTTKRGKEYYAGTIGDNATI